MGLSKAEKMANRLVALKMNGAGCDNCTNRSRDCQLSNPCVRYTGPKDVPGRDECFR